MKILVLGGNRFVGKAFVERTLSEYRYNFVDVFNRSGTGPDGSRIIQGDRNIREDLEKIEWSKYDAIVDMCLFSPEQYKLVSDLIPKETNYIFVSSASADDRYLSSIGSYGLDKKLVEDMIESDERNYKIIRPSYIVGKGNHRPRLGYYLNQLRINEPIEVERDGTEIVNLVFVQDVVEIISKMIKDKTKTMKKYFVTGDKDISINDLINKLYFWYPNKHTIRNNVIGSPLFGFDFCNFDNSDIKKDYNIKFTSLADGLIDYYKWFKQEGLKKYEFI